MFKEYSYIAVDLGAESGRVTLGTIHAGKLNLLECHRFANAPVQENGSLKWDFQKLFAEVKAGIAKAVETSRGRIAGIGIDSWGVDYGLLDADGRLIEKPYHYRDKRTNGLMQKAFELMPKEDIYTETGTQFMQINTLYQLLAAQTAGSAALAEAKNLVFIADLVAYYLCGRIFSEYTLASTSQLMNMQTGRWCEGIFDKLRLPMRIMPEIVTPPTIVGHIKSDLARQFRCKSFPVIASASHDTACAVAAVPAETGQWAYLSSGTWSLMGLELSKPVINNKSFKYEFTNEGGVAGTIRFLKNIMGLWLVQECRRQWQKQGESLSYQQLTLMVANARPFLYTIDPDADDFLAPGDMPAKINKYLVRNNQKKIVDKGQMIRIILESLAFKYRRVLERLEETAGRSIDVLHIIGGGVKNELLCRFTANATGKKVVAGPIEAATIGNIIMQAIATGRIKSLTQGRNIIHNSFELKQYVPENVGTWTSEYQKIKW